MATASIREFGKAWWSEILNRVIGAVVFIDDASAECLHYEGGADTLLSAGAVAVKGLSPFEFAKKDQKKALFLTQTTKVQLQTIAEIVRHSDFTHCILISCMSLDMVFLEIHDDKDINTVLAMGEPILEGMKYLEMKLIQWMAKKQSYVEVIHIPIFTISLTNVVFVTPPFRNLQTFFLGELKSDNATVDINNLSKQERNEARRFAASLNNMLDSMNLKEDVYYIGSYSAIIGGILEHYPISIQRRKNCLHPASLILIDRTMDLCSVTSHGTESVLDKIMAALPRFPGHCTDVAVDMSPLCEANVFNHPDDIQLSPGCLYHSDDESCIQTFEYMINKSQKEVMFDLYNKLTKIDIQKSPSPKSLLKVTPQSLEKIATATKGNYEVISKHLGVLQQSLAVVQTLKSPKRVQHELLMSLEKQVHQNLATSRESTSVLNQICHLIKNRKEKDIPLENLLALLMHIYAVRDIEVQFPADHEQQLVKTLSVALFEDKNSLYKDTSIIMSPEDCEARASCILMQLRKITSMRGVFHKYNSILKPCETGVGHEYRSAVQQLVEDMVNTDKPDLGDLDQYRSDKLKTLLRSGLGMLTNRKVKTRHPLDNPTIIIFVIGGITAEECKRLHRSVITSGVDNTVLIGATKLVTPVEAMRDILPL
uniref:SFRICE_015326 n=1 Tax=Spodoptera frugiperda TaxID=7108 RepID=A0A2H1V2I0_SPOFR